jgi:hypothetical protein
MLLTLSVIYIICFSLINFANICVMQINMKGLDGIQGPIYVGTGCVFRRQALYGYDAPKSKKPPSRTCNCWPKWCFCCCCCGNRKHKKKTTKPKTEKKKRLFFKKEENQSPAYALGEIDEGAPGTNACSEDCCYFRTYILIAISYLNLIFHVFCFL